MILNERAVSRAVVGYLEGLGYTVRCEVKGCDLAAAKGKQLLVVECKSRLSVRLLEQASRRLLITEDVYIAIPRPEKCRSRSALADLRRLLRTTGIGCLMVSASGEKLFTRCIQEPGGRRPAVSRRSREKILKECGGRSARRNQGGVHQTKIVTAYREAAIAAAVLLHIHGPLRPRDLRGLGAWNRVCDILAHNHYHWFERISRGVYRLAFGAEKEVQSDYPALWQHYRDLFDK